MKKIAMISYHTCPLASQEGKQTGGMNVYVLELSKELAKKGYQVDIFTRSQDINNQEIVPVSPGVRVIHLIAGPQTSLSRKKIAGYEKKFVEKYRAFVKKEQIEYDILHCHYYLSGKIGQLIKKYHPKLPIIVSFHTLALLKNLVARSEDEKEGQTRIDAELELTRSVDMVISPSETDSLYMQYLYNCVPEKLTFIPPGIDPSHFYPIDKKVAKLKIGIENGEKIVLFVGRIEPLKGIDALIYAMKILVTKNPDLSVRLLVIGGDISAQSSPGPSELKDLEKLRNILNIPDIVTFVGQKKQDELLYYYNSAELVVMPSHYESFGIAALEAMSCGVPVITSNVAGVSSIIDEKHASLITTVNNPLLLSMQMESLLLDEEKHKNVSRFVRQNIADLTWANTAQKTAAVYEQAIAKR